MKVRRTPEERARNPSVVQHAAPEVCAHCQPLLDTERHMHAEAFSALAEAYDRIARDLNDARAELARLRAGGHL